MEENEEHPFLGTRESFVYLLRIIFMSGELSPQMLHEATGVDIDICSQFCSMQLAEFLYGKAPKTGKKK